MRAFFSFGVTGASLVVSVSTASAVAAPPLRLIPIITAPSKSAGSGGRRGSSRLDVGQVPPLDAGVEHRHRHHEDGAEVVEPGAGPAEHPGADDALGQTDEEAAAEGDPERLQATEDRAGQRP